MVLQGPMVGQNTYAVAAALVNINISWTGLTANTDSLLKLIAVDTAGNCEAVFTNVPIHTLDNVPPITLGFDVVQIGGTFAGLQITLDEPSTACYAVMPKGRDCPAPADLFAAAATVPQGAVAAGNVSVPQGTVPAVANATGLTSATYYTVCVIAADITRLLNKQVSVTSKDFRTLDVTAPQVALTIAPGTDGNFTCDRWAAQALRAC